MARSALQAMLPPMRAALPSALSIRTLPGRMRSGRPTAGMALAGWLLLLLAGLVLAAPATTRVWHASVPAIAACTGSTLATAGVAPQPGTCADSTATAAYRSGHGDGHPQAPTPSPESPPESEPPADRCRPLPSVYLYAGRGADAAPIPANARTGHPSPDGLLPPAHAPPSAC